MVEKKLINWNFAKRFGNDIKYIVVHDTGNTRKGAGAYNHFRYFNSPGRKASAHYFVDSKEILQLVDDSMAAWHCGDGRGKFGITNSNSIGIELCINKDGDWEETKKKGRLLLRYLLEKHGLQKSSIVRHYDTSLKLCPKRMSHMGWQEWTLFYDEV